MAAPHVTGAFAILDALSPTTSVGIHLARLQSTGVSVTDPDNSVTKPRIRVLAASVLYKDTGSKADTTTSGLGVDMVSNGVGLATRVGGPSTGSFTISGIPAGALLQKAFLYWVTIGGQDAAAVLNGVPRTGTLLGASRGTCGLVNGLTPNRVYRASISTTSLLPGGNGTYTVSGVGGSGGVDSQGASLLIVYQTFLTRTGFVHINHGAMTATTTGETMTHTFKSLSLPSPPVSAHENLGLGDGQASTENPKLFAGTAITAANWLPGSDGPRWDDQTIPIPTSLLPVGTTSRTNSITTGSDCLVWAYAALQYLRS